MAHDTVTPHAADPPATRSAKHGLIARGQAALHTKPLLGPLVVLLLASLFFSVWVGSRFSDPLNISLIVQQVQIIGMVGIAQTLVVLTAGIDLSVGAITVLASVVMGKLAVDSGLPVLPALLLGLVTGGVCGGLNGTLVTRFRIPPFIATLGTLSVFSALTLFYSQSETIRAQDVPSLLSWPGRSIHVLGTEVTYSSLLMVGCFATVAYLLRGTAWGAHLHAVGDNPDGARLSGIRTDRVLLSVYVVAGVICGLAAWFLIGRIGSVSPQAGENLNLQSITAVVIGGTSLFGGRGHVLGTLLGSLIVGVFSSGLALAGVEALWQVFTVGVLVVVAVAADQWIRKVTA
ncbi:ABC transporter permease [Wenjunlia tyrosinilytica]|uniref:ABC transporter permease n=1 Tax=Wenjunlia tyrosinilytica TaxID=1544741 RepID=A0A917ZRZ2_9ACTN|nr:ABC transporter permease [Wenjunlia tyrosinilytica]GGO91955.1 ABC transporter permease [Wenjunlia tyrosinilytica]